MGMQEQVPVRVWLREHRYDDVADMIDEIMAEWRASGKKTRRNWWDVLSGGKNGRPRVIGGREFPVLRAAQKRQGKPVTKNALYHKRREPFPQIQPQPRWADPDAVEDKEEQ